jgi:hypothetical protein
MHNIKNNLTLISHFYNEEYLLPWFLKQHKNIFNHGIMINYASTDNSVNIIKEICPDWEIIDSRNKCFSPFEVDEEVMDMESKIVGWKIALNVTEHIVKLEELPNLENHVFGIHCYKMIDIEPNILPTYDKPLIEQKNIATNHNTNIGAAGNRFIHSFNRGCYSIGRHGFNNPNGTTPMLDNSKIAKYVFSPWNEDFIKRRMQIGYRIPESDIKKGMGGHHVFSREEWESQYHQHLINTFKIL